MDGPDHLAVGRLSGSDLTGDEAKGKECEDDRCVDDVAHGTTYEFLLRGNAKFHDGSPVTAPVWENALIRAFGPRVEEGALALIPSYPYSAPYEELRLKSR